MLNIDSIIVPTDDVKASGLYPQIAKNSTPMIFVIHCICASVPGSRPNCFKLHAIQLHAAIMRALTSPPVRQWSDAASANSHRSMLSHCSTVSSLWRKDGGDTVLHLRFSWASRKGGQDG